VKPRFEWPNAWEWGICALCVAMFALGCIVGAAQIGAGS